MQCNKGEENTQHLFMHCTYAKCIWELGANVRDNYATKHDNLQQIWEDLEKNTTNDKMEYKISVASYIWHVWLETNN